MSSHFVTFGAQISWSLEHPFLLWTVFWTLFLESESFLKPVGMVLFLSLVAIAIVDDGV
jgi:hypothetical protein